MRNIFIERRNNLLRVAIKENEKLIECFIEEETSEPLPGEIYRGVVKNIVPAIKCAFIDIGHKKNAYMYIDNRFKNTSIKKGQEVLVEVIKEELGDKGAKVNNGISIPGRYCVITTLDDRISFSKKIEDKEFKSKVLSSISAPKDIGVKIRTNAQFVGIEMIDSEILELYAIYEDIKKMYNYSISPKKLYGDESIINKILRDCITLDTEKITVDSKKDAETIKKYIEDKKDICLKLELYDGYRTMFDYYGIEKEILALRNHRVNLPCGGHIVIDRTEAMYVVDVNSGKNVSGKNLDKTAYITNMQAAEEIATQIRLRNLSGIIIIDFIDMKENSCKADIIRILEKGFEGDKNKTVIYPFTELNLVQIARRRKGKNIYEYIEEPCKACKGYGKKLKFSYITVLIKNEILKVDSENNIKDIYIEINDIYKDYISDNLFEFIKSIDAFNKNIYLNYVTTVEYFNVEPLIFANQIENVKKYKIEI